MRRDKYLAKMQSQLEDARGTVREFRSRPEKPTDQGRVDYRRLVEAAEKKGDDLSQRLDELRIVARDDFAALKPGFDIAREEFRSAVRCARRG